MVLRSKRNDHKKYNEAGAYIFPPGTREDFAFIYPNTYKAGMSNLGFHIIYREINERGDTACERFFLPAGPDEKKLESVETGRSLDSFPVIGVMMSFETDYFNLPVMLQKGGVPVKSADRGEHHPLIIIGGPCATFNPEPLADIADVFVIGEGEEVINEVLDGIYRNKTALRKDKLKCLANIKGIYVPRFYQPVYEDGKFAGMLADEGVPEKVEKRYIKNIDRHKGYYQIITPDTEFSSAFVIELARGCGRHCRFCMAGYATRPPRNRSFDAVWSDIGKRPPEATKVGLLGAAVCDYPYIGNLAENLMEQNIAFSVSSLRADALHVSLVRALRKNGQRTLTIAPEAGSERLRRVINKNITKDDIMNAVKIASDEGMPNIKLYFMLGLPTETMEDIVELKDLVEDIAALMHKSGRVSLSINPFIPKPFTPFQWERMIDAREFEEKIGYLKSSLRKVAIKAEPLKSAVVQSVLSLGDRRMGELIITASEKGGLKEFWRIVKKQNLQVKYDTNDKLPWDHINLGFGKNWLLKERELAEAGAVTAICNDGCIRCGVCGKE